MHTIGAGNPATTPEPQCPKTSGTPPMTRKEVPLECTPLLNTYNEPPVSNHRNLSGTTGVPTPTTYTTPAISVQLFPKKNAKPVPNSSGGVAPP